MRSIGAIFASLVVLVATALPAHAASRRPYRLIHLTLQLKWLPQAQFAGYFVARDLGFYRQEGLDVSIRPGGPTVTPETAVSRGRADLGVDWLSGLLVARDHGARLTNIAQMFQGSGMRLVTFKSSGIRSVPQFRGKRVGIWYAGNQYPFFALMSRFHLSPPARYLTVVSQDFTMRQFLARSIDVASVTTYNELGILYEHGVKRKALRIFNYKRLGVTMLEDGLFGRTGWLAAHSAAVTRFLRASIRGWRWAVRHPVRAGVISFRHESRGYSTRAHQIYMARAVARLVRAGLHRRHTIGYMNPRLYSATWRTLLSEHVISRPPGVAYDQRYWRAAGGH